MADGDVAGGGMDGLWEDSANALDLHQHPADDGCVSVRWIGAHLPGGDLLRCTLHALRNPASCAADLPLWMYTATRAASTRSCAPRINVAAAPTPSIPSDWPCAESTRRKDARLARNVSGLVSVRVVRFSSGPANTWRSTGAG